LENPAFLTIEQQINFYKLRQLSPTISFNNHTFNRNQHESYLKNTIGDSVLRHKYLEPISQNSLIEVISMHPDLNYFGNTFYYSGIEYCILTEFFRNKSNNDS